MKLAQKNVCRFGFTVKERKKSSYWVNFVEIFLLFCDLLGFVLFKWDRNQATVASRFQCSSNVDYVGHIHSLCRRHFNIVRNLVFFAYTVSVYFSVLNFLYEPTAKIFCLVKSCDPDLRPKKRVLALATALISKFDLCHTKRDEKKNFDRSK